MIYLGLGLDGSTVFQQELDDADVAVPGCTVKRSQLVLHGDGFKQRSGAFSDRRDEQERRDGYATLVLASICAPRSSRSLTIITLPLLEAI